MGIVKWSGGKAKEAKTIVSYFPSKDTIDIYSEPFVGAGSCLLEYKPYKFICSDINFHIISIYRALQKYPDKFISNLVELITRYYYSDKKEDFYLSLRKEFNIKGSPNTYFYFLLLFGYNGLCRFNSKGEFNTAWGSDKHYYDLDLLVEKLDVISNFLSSVDGRFYQANYSFCTNTELTSNSFIYFDPPYDKTFNQYDKSLVQGFNQEELFNYITREHKCKWLMTNSGTSYIRDLYKDYEIIGLPTKRSLGPKESRVKITDVIIKNF